MLLFALKLTGAALGAFVILFTLVAIEQRRGRFLFPRVRARLDSGLTWLVVKVEAMIHLPRMMKHTASTAASQARSVAATSRATSLARRRTAVAVPHHSESDSHLATLRKHRSDTALTPEEAKKLRHLKLEERF
ncbi:hypothetical protein KC887_05420 [Candidatus Kaiserbacteria bacterium]|nr:hypothetical protein [Candidatus Kaiserbacteria bacterium]